MRSLQNSHVPFQVTAPPEAACSIHKLSLAFQIPVNPLLLIPSGPLLWAWVFALSFVVPYTTHSPEINLLLGNIVWVSLISTCHLFPLYPERYDASPGKPMPHPTPGWFWTSCLHPGLSVLWPLCLLFVTLVGSLCFCPPQKPTVCTSYLFYALPEVLICPHKTRPALMGKN